MLANQLLKTAAAITLATGAIAPPAASAHSPPPDPTDAGCGPTAEPTIVHLDSNSGFDWLDAGIGAAGGIAISIAAVGGVLTISQRRARRSHDSATDLS